MNAPLKQTVASVSTITVRNSTRINIVTFEDGSTGLCIEGSGTSTTILLGEQEAACLCAELARGQDKARKQRRRQA